MIYMSFVFHKIRCIHYWQKLSDVLFRACESDSYNYIPKGFTDTRMQKQHKIIKFICVKDFFSTSVSVLLMQNRNF